MIMCFYTKGVPALTLGTLDDHDSMVVHALREHVRRTLNTLGNLACECQRVLGLIRLLCFGQIQCVLWEVSCARRCTCCQVGVEPLVKMGE